LLYTTLVVAVPLGLVGMWLRVGMAVWGDTDSAREARLSSQVEAALAGAGNRADARRAEWCRALGRLGAEPRRLIPVLIDAARDEREDVRTAAATALRWGPVGDSALIALRDQTLCRLLSDPDVEVRRAAIGAVEALGSDPRRAECLTARLSDEFPEIRVLAARALLRIDPPSAPKVGRSLVPLLADPEPVIDRRLVIEVLVQVEAGTQEEVVAALIPLLAYSDESVRASAIDALRAFGSSASSALPSLWRLFRDKGSGVRGLAGMAILEIGGEGQPYEPEVHAAIVSDPHVELEQRGGLLESLMVSGPASVPNVSAALIRQLGDAQPGVRQDALELLRQLSDAGPIKLPQ
jgi:HEAT repeat protein